VLRRDSASGPGVRKKAKMANQNGRRDLVVVGGSAGALDALKDLLAHLPKDFGAAILVVIHIPDEFPSYLAEILGHAGPLPAKQVHKKERIKEGVVYVAPPDRHLLVDDGHVDVSRGPRENRHRPAIDPLFRSAARAKGKKLIGIILSGYHDDGSSGLMAVKMWGGLTVVQSAEEALSPEMPTKAKYYASAEYELPVREIAKMLTQWTKEPPTAERQGDPEMREEISKEADKADLMTDANADKAGVPSVFSCPECGGVLWELQEGDLLRFRCRVGHAYTADALGVAMTGALEQALWASMRAMEEKAAWLRRVAEWSGQKLGAKYEDEATGFDRHVEAIRKILAANQRLQEEEEAVGGAG
jgi:two-component system, chemotaxis family, protein-glutamate methylesterase/glutaminase